MKKTGQGILFEFKNRKDMFVFESICKKPPHSVQLSRFWSRGTPQIRVGTNEKNTKI